MSSKLEGIIRVLGFYSVVFTVATAYYYAGKLGETPPLPFVEGLSLMVVSSSYSKPHIVARRFHF